MSEKCLDENGLVMTPDTEFCSTHNCGAHDPCNRLDCPHCQMTEKMKLKLSNSYLKDKDRGEVE